MLHRTICAHYLTCNLNSLTSASRAATSEDICCGESRGETRRAEMLAKIVECLWADWRYIICQFVCASVERGRDFFAPSLISGFSTLGSGLCKQEWCS